MRDGPARVETLLCDILPRLADAETALLQLDRFLETTFSPSGILEDFCRHPWQFALFGTMTTASGYVSDVLVRDPELFRWLTTTGVLDEQRSREEMLTAARDTAGRFATHEKRVKALRRFHRRELLRIAAADLMHRVRMEDTTRMLSDLADAILATLLDEAKEHLQARYTQRPTSPLVLLALGKLGGRELNYSSDIDLMAVYGANEDLGGGRWMQDYAVDLVKELIRLLTVVSPEGMFYRTDFRLRPDGSAGPLARSLAATLSYYEGRGAQWERQMLIKARPAAGDHDFGKTVIERLRPFVYPRHNVVPPSVLLRDVTSRLRERWALEHNVKHFRGGIRHIEFSLQTLQLLHGGNLPTVREQGSLPAVQALRENGLIEAEEADTLGAAYRFFRRVEHLLQLDRFEQTHTLPDVDGMKRLARLMETADTETFLSALSAHRDGVARVCDAILATGIREGLPGLQHLEGLGYARPQNVHALLHEMLVGREGRQHEHAAAVLAEQAIPRLAVEAAREALPEGALRALEQLVNRCGHPSAVLGMLREKGPRRFLLRLASLSPVAIRDLTADPVMLDAIFSGRAEEYSVQDEPGRLKHAVEIDALGRFLLGHSTLEECSAELSALADRLAKSVLGGDASSVSPLLLLALGKFGGRELSPGSDLDVVFLYDATHTGSEGAQQSARRFITTLQGGGGAGQLYTVDARLRPEGRNAPLAVSVDSYNAYLAERASLWEKQSLLRARVVAGPRDLAAEVERVIGSTLDGVETGPETWREIAAMRTRMEPVNRFSRPGFFDIKLSPGGLVDAEFALQMLMLASHGRLRCGSSLEAFPLAIDHYPDLSGPLREMQTQYARLRLVQYRLRLLCDVPGNVLPDEDSQQDILARSLGYHGPDEMLDDIAARARAMRAGFTSILKQLSSP